MKKHDFLNRLRSLHNIDSDKLPELSDDEWLEFRNDPPRYMMRCPDHQANAIWREIEKRQVTTTAARRIWEISSEESIQIHAPGMWENDAGPEDWYAISDDDGIKAYAATDEIAAQIQRAARMQS